MQDVCGNCNSGGESYEHLFLMCDVAQACWRSAGLTAVIQNSWQGGQTIGEWLANILTANSAETVRKVFVVLWSIWKERNARVWNNKYMMPSWIVKLGLDELAEWEKVRDKADGSAVRANQGCSKWHPPMGESYKCNVDAATFMEVGRTGAGMVLRDREGHIRRHRRASWVGVWSSKEAEAKALLEALSWVEMEQYRQVTFESDAEVVVKALEAECHDLTEFGELVRACRAVLCRNPNFCVRSIPSNFGNCSTIETFNVSYNLLIGPIPFSGTIFPNLHPSSFLGNDGLCGGPASRRCASPAANTMEVYDRSRKTSATAKAIVWVTATTFRISLFVLVATTRCWIQNRRKQESRREIGSWKLTTFQRLNFTAEDVLECLETSNNKIIGKGSGGTVYKTEMPGEAK
ncbi:Leucine-rich repeat receptor-like protein kinase TDR [Linum perenne]